MMVFGCAIPVYVDQAYFDQCKQPRATLQKLFLQLSCLKLHDESLNCSREEQILKHIETTKKNLLSYLYGVKGDSGLPPLMFEEAYYLIEELEAQAKCDATNTIHACSKALLAEFHRDVVEPAWDVPKVS